MKELTEERCNYSGCKDEFTQLLRYGERRLLAFCDEHTEQALLKLNGIRLLDNEENPMQEM